MLGAGRCRNLKRVVTGSELFKQPHPVTRHWPIETLKCIRERSFGGHFCKAQERRFSEGEIKVSERENPRKVNPRELSGRDGRVACAGPGLSARVKVQEPRLVLPYEEFVPRIKCKKNGRWRQSRENATVPCGRHASKGESQERGECETKLTRV